MTSSSIRETKRGGGGGGGVGVKTRLDYRAREAVFQVRGPLDSSAWGSGKRGREWYESFSVSWHLPVFMQRFHLMHVMKTLMASAKYFW